MEDQIVGFLISASLMAALLIMLESLFVLILIPAVLLLWMFYFLAVMSLGGGIAIAGIAIGFALICVSFRYDPVAALKRFPEACLRFWDERKQRQKKKT